MRVERWDQALTTDQSNLIVLLLARWHSTQIKDRETFAHLISLVEAGDVVGLCQCDVPLGSDPQDYLHARQITAFFSKRADLTIEGVNPRAAATESFVQAELLCKATNEIFRARSEGRFLFSPRVEAVLHRSQRKISAILGDLPELSELKLRFGPGATTQVKKKDASARRKLAQVFCCSEDAIEILPDLFLEMPDWAQITREGSELVGTLNVRIDKARVDFVRKTAKTDRTIAVEPSLNQMVQLAVGDHISYRLGRVGVDLRDQTRNQRLAKQGSITGALATLDLSSASDTVAYGLVLDLLPIDWVEFLSKVRSSRVKVPGGEVILQKFSTMGNGFTFALESLIFFALAKSCTEEVGSLGEVSVYGDDIIVPTEAFGLLQTVLEATGFLLNVKKSFSTGPFRESCGKDYYSGISVRPRYIKDVLSGETLFVLHNHYVREGFPEPASDILSMISNDLRIYGPDGYGDGHLLGAYHPVRHRPQDGWAGHTFETFTRKANRAFYTLGADYVFPSYSIYVSGDADVSEPIYPHVVRQKLPRYIWTREGPFTPKKQTGNIRPDLAQSGYQADQKGVRHLSDPLPGFKGCKRIKIYTLTQ
jgi:hypothetical protein